MTELKRSLDRALSGVEFRPELRRRAREAMRLEEDVKMRGKMSAALVFALIAALILAGVAVAAVMTRGFGWFATRYDDAAWQYNMNELDGRAEDLLAQQIVLNADGTGEAFRFEVTQGYYDGTRADVAYNLDISDRSADTSWRPTADELSKMENLGDGASSFFENRFEGLNEEFARSFEEKKAIGVSIHDYFLSDGAYLMDGTRLEWTDGGEQWEGNAASGYRNFEPLPEEARNGDSIQILFRVKEYDTYYYQDEAGTLYYESGEPRTFDLAPVTLTRGERDTRAVRGMKDFGTYAVWAEASVSPVGVKATVWQKLPKEWINADVWTRDSDLKKIDYVSDYLVIADGTRLEGRLVTEGYAGAMTASESFSGEDERRSIPDAFRKEAPEGLYSMEITAQGVPEGTKELRLRPVYSVSGERPEEDVVLKLPD